jgi:type IV secretion system protein VirD4
MSLNTRKTNLNNNILVIGGSGAGKSFRIAKPILMTLSSSFIITDPKGELLRDMGGFLKNNGYDLKVLNLNKEQGMRKASHYNPFVYIKSDADVLKLTSNFMKNTKQKEGSGGDQFWEDSAAGLLNALIYYTWYEGVEIDGKIHKSFKGVVQLLRKAQFKENAMTGAKEDSELDLMFSELEEENPNHLAVIYYNKTMRGAADTVRSIIQTLNSRFGNMENETLLNMLDDDEMNLQSIGARKTAIFCVIPDSDKTFNFVVGMLYLQAFQELYYQADFVYGGELPTHVTFLLDEFANVALPDDYCSLLSTMRSRNISSIIIIQNLAQIKAMFKETWETIPGNCDTLIYLGGNEQSTHEYISKMLGKKTIDKRSTGETRGSHGSSSKNFDVIARELMLPEEVREIKTEKCLVLIRGYHPILDDKIRTWEHPFWDQVIETQKHFHFDARLERVAAKGGKDGTGVRIIDGIELDVLKRNDAYAMKEYEEEKYVAEMTGENEPERPKMSMIELSFDELMQLDIDELEQNEPFLDLDLELLERNRRKIQENYYEENVSEDDTNIASLDSNDKDTLDVFGSAADAMQCMTLMRKGYSMEQVTSIMRLTKKHKNLTTEKIEDLMSRDMSIDEIESMVTSLP